MKQPLLLLHGALGAAAQLQPLAELLQADFEVYTYSFSGHGGRELAPAHFGMTQFADEISQFLEAHGLKQVHAFGYSMGGYAAILSAVTDPGRIISISTLGTKFDWSPETAAAEVKMLDPEKIAAKVPQYAEQLRQLHAPTDWRTVVTATAAMLTELGTTPVLNELNLAHLTLPVQVLVGEQDALAGVEASRQFATWLPSATFEVLPATPHPIDKVDMQQIAARIRQFSRQ